jgi:hypothetical protein
MFFCTKINAVITDSYHLTAKWCHIINNSDIKVYEFNIFILSKLSSAHYYLENNLSTALKQIEKNCRIDNKRHEKRR